MSLKLFTNGRIYSSFRPLVIVESLVIENEKVKYAGYEEKALRELEGNEYETIDLNGKTLIPGFVDAHMHLDELGKSLYIIDLRGTKSLEELRAKVISSSKGGNGWIIGHGWDQELFMEKRWPNRFDLDSISKERPIFLSRVDLHSAVLNTKAIGLLNLSQSEENSKDLVKDEKGEITGVVKETMFDLAKEKVNESISDDQLMQFLIDGINYAASLGLTSLGYVSCSYRALKMLEKINKEGKLKIRVSAYINSNEIEKANYFESYGNLSLKGVKIFTDGSLGSRTALLSEPYSDEHENRGKRAIEEKAFLNLCRKAESMGLHIATHAIGDEALDMVLDVYAELKGRHRVEHLSIIREDQFSRLVQVGATAVVQPHFLITDFWILDRIGHERARMFHPFNTMLKSGIKLAFSTDCPVEPLSPLDTVYAAVTRGKNEKVPVYEYSKEELVGIADALDAYTAKSSEAIKEMESGFLGQGSNADFIVLSKNPFFQRESKIPEIKIIETWVAGTKVFG